MKTRLFMSAIVIALFFAGCKGDQGDPGPAGNANVSVTTVVVLPSDWQGDGNGGWVTDLGASGYDPTASGVSIYWSTDDANFAALPFSGYIPGAPDINYSLNSSDIAVFYDPQTAAGSIDQPNSTFYFNVVIIPQPQVAKMKAEHVNMKDYNEVQAYIKLNSK